MKDVSKIDFSDFDKPEILRYLFHPRLEQGRSSNSDWEDILIPTENDLVIGARCHRQDKVAPTILFFHGNGEIVDDYNDIGTLYQRLGINFFPVDYRGYGRSTGLPTVTGMMRDCHYVFDFLSKWLEKNGYTGPLIIMGRSLGSASALELASCCKNDVDGLIIESGFAYVMPLLELIGVQTGTLKIEEEAGFNNFNKIRNFDKPTLIIHAQNDHIIPFSEGQVLFDESPSPDKKMLQVEGADHNTVFFHAIEDYMKAVKELVELTFSK